MPLNVRLPSGEAVPGDFTQLQFIGEVRSAAASSLQIDAVRLAVCGEGGRQLDDAERVEPFAETGLQVLVVLSADDQLKIDRDEESAALAVEAAEDVLNQARAFVLKDAGDGSSTSAWLRNELATREASLRASIAVREKILKEGVYGAVRKSTSGGQAAFDGNTLLFPLPESTRVEDLGLRTSASDGSFDASLDESMASHVEALPDAWWGERNTPSQEARVSPEISSMCNLSATSKTRCNGYAVIGLGGAGRRIVEAMCAARKLPKGMREPDGAARVLVCDDDPLPRTLPTCMRPVHYVHCEGCSYFERTGRLPARVKHFVKKASDAEWFLCIIAGVGGTWAQTLGSFLTWAKTKVLVILVWPALASSLLPVSHLEPYQSLFAVGDMLTGYVDDRALRFIDNAALLRKASEDGLEGVNALAARCVFKAIVDNAGVDEPLTTEELALQTALSEGTGSEHRGRNAYLVEGICKRVGLQGSSSARRDAIIQLAAGISRKTRYTVRLENENGRDLIWLELDAAHGHADISDELENAQGPLLPWHGGPLLASSLSALVTRVHKLLRCRAYFHWIVGCGISEDSIPFQYMDDLSEYAKIISGGD